MHSQPIKSYVRREGRITARQKNALSCFGSQYVLPAEQKIMDWACIFGRTAPQILEIGFGMGDALLHCATHNPQYNYIGIEVYRPGVGALLANAASAALTNLAVFCDDARTVFERCIPNHSLDCVNIFFPDPWPKRRHHKRRLITASLLALLSEKIRPQGYLHIATDWAPYASVIKDTIQASRFFHPIDDGASPLLHRPKTKYEHRGTRLGHVIQDIHAQAHH